MNSLLDTLESYTTHVFVNPDSKDGSFRMAVGLLGAPYLTSPTLTRLILESSEFNQLSGSDRATRILEMVLAHAQG